MSMIIRTSTVCPDSRRANAAALSALVPRGHKNELWRGLGSRLLDAREKQGISGRELCREAGVSSAVSHLLETGTAAALDTVERFAAALGLPPGWLAFGPEGFEPFMRRRPRAPLPPDRPEPDELRRVYRGRCEAAGSRIAHARTQAGLSMRSASAAAGVSVQTWSNTESGATVPKVDSLERMAVALDVAPAWLAFGDDDFSS